MTGPSDLARRQPATDGIRIVNIADCMEVAPVIARWHFDEWGHLEGSAPLQQRVKDLHRQNGYAIPTTYVAWAGDSPVGSASIVDCDMETRRDLSPWLAGVYVMPAFRRRGIAMRLVGESMAAAKRLGFMRLYLWTHSAVAVYASAGWKEDGYEYFAGKKVTLMAVDL